MKYFPARMDRYNHDLCGEDTDETEDSPLFGFFNSYSPQYKKQNSSRFLTNVSDANSSCGSLTITTGEVGSDAGSDGSLNNSCKNKVQPSRDPCKILARPELRKLDVNFFFILFIRV